MTGLTLRLRRWLAAPALIAGLLAALPAAAADVELPPVDQVFVLSAQATARDRIEVRWKIADGYYLYRHRTSVKTGAAFASPTLALPTGDKHRDEFFGDVETYRQQLVGVVRGTPAADAAGVALTVKYQGCADAGVCYPPQTRTLTVALPPAAGSADAGFLPTRKGGLFALGGADAGAVDAAPLPAEQAFTSELIALDGNTLLLRLTPARGYYLYRDNRDRTRFRLDADGIAPGKPQWPAGRTHRDEHFGDVAVYFDQVEIPLPVTRTTTAAARTTLVLGLQGCQTDGICYPPMTRTVDVPTRPQSEVAAREADAQTAQAAALLAIQAPGAAPTPALASDEGALAPPPVAPSPAVIPDPSPGFVDRLALHRGGGDHQQAVAIPQDSRRNRRQHPFDGVAGQPVEVDAGHQPSWLSAM